MLFGNFQIINIQVYLVYSPVSKSAWPVSEQVLLKVITNVEMARNDLPRL